MKKYLDNNSNNIDHQLIVDVKENNSSDSLKELELKHSGICHKMIKKYYHNMLQSGIDPEDVIAEKTYVIYKSILNFDPSKNVKFSTWLGNQMRYHCLNSINKNNQLITMEDDAIKNIIEKNQLKITNKNIYNKEQSDLIFSILDRIKDSRIKKIFKLRYFNGKRMMSWGNIGKRLNLSTQTIINLHTKGKKFLKNKLKSDFNSDIL